MRAGHHAAMAAGATMPNFAVTPSPTQTQQPPPTTPLQAPAFPQCDDTAENDDTVEDNPTTQSLFPPFDRLCHDSVVSMCDDWFGEGESSHSGHGGIKSLYGNKNWRKTLGNDAHKREADKKMSQKIKRIGECMEKKRLAGSTREEVITAIESLLAASPKTKACLTGIDKLLKSEA